MSDLLGYHADLVRQGIFRGVDLNTLAERLWRLDAMRSEGPLPRLRWRALTRPRATFSGRAFTGQRRIVISLGAAATIEDAAEVVLHELVHCACPPCEHHGELFCRRFIACAREGFGLDVSTSDLLALSTGAHGKRAYAIGDVVRKAMAVNGVAERLRADPAYRFEPPPPEVAPPPPETPEAIAARRNVASVARMAEREAHARAKLGEWERKVSAAKRHATKWRRKVAYYDRKGGK